jgi:flagellar biosynthesis/type III secretory pathway chaperone
MTSADAIMKILDEQVSGYRMLLELLQREKACLVDFDAGEIEEISKEKDTMVLRLRLLEEERIRLMNRFQDENPEHVKPGDVSLRKLGEITGNEKFLDVRSRLVSLMQSIQELNGLNRTLIDRSLAHVRGSTGFFENFGLDPAGAGKGSLVSEET